MGLLNIIEAKIIIRIEGSYTILFLTLSQLQFHHISLRSLWDPVFKRDAFYQISLCLL